ncbi:hypothetical protein U607_02725 [Staphylococcus aureus F36687]|nr:hypothetical protein U607_02725 [Staphylococcus aureus F36687]EWT80290.1 hypothetical protein V330_02776 [Staphylococcus aureus F85609]EWV01728.1 hypothetical protein U621_02860 [Staphylococcus aureus F53393]
MMKQQQIVDNENQDNFSKDTYIMLIDLMIGLTDLEVEELKTLDERKLRFKYKMALTEKTDEMVG